MTDKQFYAEIISSISLTIALITSLIIFYGYSNPILTAIDSVAYFVAGVSWLYVLLSPFKGLKKWLGIK